MRRARREAMLQGTQLRRVARHGVLIAVAASAIASAPPAAAATAGGPQLLAKQGMAVLISRYQDGLIGSSWWQAAVAQSTLESYQQATGRLVYQRYINATFNRYRGGNFERCFPQHSGPCVVWMDDTAWWALAWLQEYGITRYSPFLQAAEKDADYIHRYWDGVCGGGVWWNSRPARYQRGLQYKTAISNTLFLELTAWLAAVLPAGAQRDTYLHWAQAEDGWIFRSGLVSHGIVVDGLNGRCRPGGEGYSYNQGTIVAGLAMLARGSGDSQLLDPAHQIAGAALAQYGHSGVLRDPNEASGDTAVFKGIFARGLKLLSLAAGTSAYDGYFATWARAIKAHDTTPGHQFGPHWAGPLGPLTTASQIAGEAELVATLGIPTGT